MSVGGWAIARLRALVRGAARPPVRAAPAAPTPPAVMPRLPEVVAGLNDPGFFFINIGANDGVSNDPIYPFLRQYGWRGIAVEPIPHVCEELRRNYCDFPGVVIENCAIAAHPRPMFFVPPGPGRDQPFLRQISSFDRAYMERTIGILRERPELLGEVPAGLEQFITTLPVACLTFEELLRKHDARRIDFLNIDAEHSDFEVFSMIDLTRHRPPILCVETATFTEPEEAEFRRRVRVAGYEYLEHFGPFSEVYVHAHLR